MPLQLDNLRLLQTAKYTDAVNTFGRRASLASSGNGTYRPALPCRSVTPVRGSGGRFGLMRPTVAHPRH